VTATAGTEAHADNARLLRDLEAATEEDRWNLLLTRMQQEVASVLGFGAGEQPALDEGFFKLGMDSLTSVELKTRLEAALGRALPPTLAFEYSTIESLARHLYSELFGTTPAENAGLAELEQLSEEDAHAELLAELASLKRELQ
jgi:acyl carrier protein